MDDVIYLTEDFIPVDKDDPRMVMVKVRMPDGKIVFGFPEKPKQNQLFIHGGQGSGNFDHSGRPGLVGGSGKGEGPRFGGGDVYHGTIMEDAKKIVHEGFRAGGKNRKGNYGRKPAVYFTESESTLESNFGNIVHFQFSIPPKLISKIQFDKVDEEMYGAEENWFIEDDIPASSIYAVYVDGKRYSVDQFKKRFT